MANPLVSIIIPTYNEEDNIDRCLGSLANQSYKKIETIVVDSIRTSDKTSQIAKEFTDKVYKFGEERSQQRNFGAKKAKGEYLLFIDADMRLSRGVMRDCVAKLKKDVLAVIIPEKSIGESYWAKCKALEKNCYIGDDAIEAPRFFHTKTYLELGGFNEGMVSGEDWDLGRRFREKGKVERIKSLIYHYEGKLSLLADLKKKYYYAQKSDKYLENNLKGVGDVFRFIIRPAYIRNWKVLIFHPVLLLGFVIMKFSELIVGGFGAILYKKNFWKKILNTYF